MTALALLDGTARALTGGLLLAVITVALLILVTGLRDAVDNARDVIDNAPVPPPLPVLVAGEHAEDIPIPAIPACLACGVRDITYDGDQICAACDPTHRRNR